MKMWDAFRLSDPKTLDEEIQSSQYVSSGFTGTRTITASAERLQLKNTEDMEKFRWRPYTEWQNDAWGYYDAIGEIKYAFGILASLVSRIRLYPGIKLDHDAPPIGMQSYRRRVAAMTKEETETETKRELVVPKELSAEVMAAAEEILLALSEGDSGIPGMLRAFTINMSVAGECYLIQIEDKWHIKSSNEILVDASGNLLLRTQRSVSGVPTNGSATGLNDKMLPEDTKITRFWREHPRYSEEPESSMLSLREVCDELLTLQRMIRVVARSNMNAGLLLISEDMRVAGDSITEDIKTEQEESEALLKSLYDNFTAGIIDETSSSTIVPNVLTGPTEAVNSVKWIDMQRKIDQFLVERCDRALERILQGLDMPKDFVTGLASVRFTNGKQIEESLYKSHVEPLVIMLCDGLTNAYLISELKERFPDLSEETLRLIRVWYDATEVVSKADPADAADKGFEKFLVSADAWRAAHGFADSDAPGELETALRVLLKQTLDPALVTTLFNTLFQSITAKERQANLKKMATPFPESAQEMLYGEVVAPTEETYNENSEITPEEDEEPVPEEAMAASASVVSARRLYTIPYNGNTIQDQYRMIAETCVRGGDFEMKTFSTAKLTPTQPLDRTLMQSSGSGAKDLPPIVVVKDGVSYLLDGHHRAQRKAKIEAATVDVDSIRTDLASETG